MKHKIFLQTRPAEAYESIDIIDGFKYSVWTSKDVAYLGWTFVNEMEIDFEIPQGFDPRTGVIQVLKDRKEMLLAETQEQVMKIDEQINKMLALEYTA